MLRGAGKEGEGEEGDGARMRSVASKEVLFNLLGCKQWCGDGGGGGRRNTEVKVTTQAVHRVTLPSTATVCREKTHTTSLYTCCSCTCKQAGHNYQGYDDVTRAAQERM